MTEKQRERALKALGKRLAKRKNTACERDLDELAALTAPSATVHYTAGGLVPAKDRFSLRAPRRQTIHSDEVSHM